MDLFTEQEAEKWTICGKCINAQFTSLTDPRLKIAKSEWPISFQQGEFMFEFSGKSEIPIRWECDGEEKTFNSVLHLCMYELAIKKDVVEKAESVNDVEYLIDNGLVDLDPEWDTKRIAVLRSVCLLQIEQHPVMKKLMLNVTGMITTGDIKAQSAEDLFLRDDIAIVWMEIADNIKTQFG